MNAKGQLTLYTGTDCHLCDLAKGLLQNIANDYRITEINVKQQREYFHEYGARIPVLTKAATGEELPWPFDPDQLSVFLKD
ncbi:MAG: glutaredoxin family protein [Aestuariibacter sp.]